jgi:ribosomal protein S18 acetylase RimI-like enzyme
MELGDLPYEVRTFYDFDLEEVIDIVSAEKSRAYESSDITRALSPGPPGGHYGYVTIQDITDRIIGWLKAQPDSEGNLQTLRVNVIVVPDRRRKGVGTAMLEHFIAEARAAGVGELRVNARPDEDVAIAFLESRGFHRDGETESSRGEIEFVRDIT